MVDNEAQVIDIRGGTWSGMASQDLKIIRETQDNVLLRVFAKQTNTSINVKKKQKELSNEIWKQRLSLRHIASEMEYDRVV